MKDNVHKGTMRTGFTYREISVGNVFRAGSKDYNHLMFVLEGYINVTCNEFSYQMMHKGQFVLFPISADVLCRAVSNCRVLTFTFETLPESFNAACRSYAPKHVPAARTTLTTLPPVPLFDNFFDLLLVFLRDGLDEPIIHQIKGEELFILLYSFYEMKYLYPLFQPVVSVYPDFRVKVMRSYRAISNVKELSDAIGVETKTFYRRFKAEFDTSPCRWMLNQKARHIHFSLSESGLTLEDVRKKHGFKFSAHFTRFCREQLHCTPLQLRKKLQQRPSIT